MPHASSGGPERSRRPEDLSAEWALKDCARVELDGRSYPSVGRIALLARLGQGGMGVVYYGIHPRLGTEVAVKVLPRELMRQQSESVDRFVREARLAARLRSDHLVSVIDVDRDEATGAHYLVMEYVRGDTAGRLLRDAAAAGTKGLPEAVALDLCIAATRGLVAAHLQGVMHRDIKPENILVPVAADGTVQFGQAKLSDLGLARTEAPDESITHTAVAMGTPGFMAPEQAQDARGAKKPADVFSMGATLYALLTGAPPFKGATSIDTLLRTIKGEFERVRTLRPDVSAATAALLDRCLSLAPADRLPDAPALLEGLELCRSSLAARDAGPETVSRLDLLVHREEQGKRVVSDPLATPTPPRPPEDAAPVTAPGIAPPAAPPRPHLARRPAGAERRSGAPLALVALVVLVAVAVLAFVLTRGGPGDAARAPGLFVDSTPQGATVYVDGAARGTTPFVAAGLEGTHALRVELTGHVTYEVSAVTIGPGGRCDLRPLLERVRAEDGLEVVSDPPGAVVTIDRAPAGRSPLHNDKLAYGVHEVTVTLQNYRTWRKPAVEVRKGEKTVLRMTLERATNGLNVTGGAPGATVVLTRSGPPPKTYELVLDARGGATSPAIEAGDYAVHATAAGFAAWTGSVAVRADAPAAEVVARMPEHDGALTVASKPPGAEISVDGRVIGTAPLVAAAVPAGEHVVDIRLADHVAVSQNARIRGDATTDLGVVELTAYGSLDLSKLLPDVVARAGTQVLANGVRLPPGTIVVVLDRPGHAPQQRKLVVEAGGTTAVEASPWEGFQARLDVSGLPAGIRVLIDGKPVDGTAASWPAAREAGVVLVRPGYETVVLKVPVALGATATIPEVQWIPRPTRLDLADFGPDFNVTVDGKKAVDGMVLAPGTHNVTWTPLAVKPAPGTKPGPVRNVISTERATIRVDAQRWVRLPVYAASSGVTAAALEWLKDHQSPDGRWDCDGFDAQCKVNRCPGPGGAVHDVGVTALALRAFLQAGETFEDGPHAETLALAVAYLLSVQDAEGCFGPRTSARWIYDHAMATSAIVDAYRLSGREDLKPPAQRAVGFIVHAQNPYLAWRYGVRSGENDTSVTSWMMRALWSADRAGLAVDKDACTGALSWVDKMTEPEFGRVGYQQRGGPAWRDTDMEAKFPADLSESLTAAGATVRIWCAGTDFRKDKAVLEFLVKTSGLLAKKLPRWDPDAGTIDFIYWNLGTQFMTRLGGDAWKRWAEALHHALIGGQRTEKDRDERGSWDPEDPWSAVGGRVYATAINCLTVTSLGR